MEQPGAHGIFQLGHLPANRRLLNSVRHMARCRADALVFGDIKEQFEVMNVHPSPSILLKSCKSIIGLADGAEDCIAVVRKTGDHLAAAARSLNIRVVTALGRSSS
jgi:hypothetical protein